MQVKVSTLRKIKIDALKHGKLHRTKRSQKCSAKYLLKIIHLNDDCLEEIFFQLDVTDLAKAADANVRLAFVAANVFARKYQHQEIEVGCHQYMTDAYDTGRAKYKEMRMILEHFGKHITKLNINFWFRWDEQQIVDTISEYCSNTLLELKLSRMRSGVLFRKPYIKLEKLVFYQSFFEFFKPIDEISVSFPNIRSIELQNVRYAFQSIFLEHHLPTLVHFGYYTFPYVQFSTSDLQSIHRIVQLNPQIKSLGMYLSERDMADERMQPMNMSMEPMPGIEVIDAVCDYPMANGPFEFANVKHLKLNGKTGLNRGWLEITHQIEQLDLMACSIDEHMTNFIVSCRNMQHMEIAISDYFDMEHITHIAKNLTSLKEIHFLVYDHNKEQHTTALTAVIEFMRHCPQLTRAVVAHDIKEGDEFRSRYKHNVYTKSRPIIKLYREKINKSLPTRWRINHVLKPAELVKGYEGYHSYLFFQVSFEKYCLPVA